MWESIKSYFFPAASKKSYIDEPLTSVSSAVDQQLPEAPQATPYVLTCREKALHTVSIASETSSLPGAVGVVLSTLTKGGQQDSMGLFWTFLMGPYWNVWGIIQWALSFPDERLKAKESALHTYEKFIFLSIHAIFYPLLYLGFTVLAYALAVTDATSSDFWNSSKLLGNRLAWIASNTVFWMDLALITRRDFTSLYRSNQKSDPIQLLNYLYKKHLAVTDNPHIPGDKKSMIAYKLQALYLACKANDDLKAKISDGIAELALPEMDREVATAFASFLLNKESYKVSQLKGSLLVNGCFSLIAAGCGVGSMATEDPVAKGFQYPSAVLYIFSAVVRHYMLLKLCCSSEKKEKNPTAFILERLSMSGVAPPVSRRDIALTRDHSSLLWKTHPLFGAGDVVSSALQLSQ